MKMEFADLSVGEVFTFDSGSTTFVKINSRCAALYKGEKEQLALDMRIAKMVPNLSDSVVTTGKKIKIM